jgi:hypothetical protein
MYKIDIIQNMEPKREDLYTEKPVNDNEAISRLVISAEAGFVPLHRKF